MPTTNQEADTIIKLCIKHGLKPRALIGLAKDLQKEVGEVTTNDSVRVTMNMLYDRAMELKAAHIAAWSASIPWLTIYWMIVIGHAAVWVGLVLSCLMSLIYQPLYITMPMISFCVYLATTDRQCPVTRWENAVRKQLGWPQITHFSHWYVFCPLAHGRTCNKKCSTMVVDA